MPGLAIARPVTTSMLFVALGLLGVLSWRTLPAQLLPDFALPQVYVQAVRQGASPEALEADVVRPLEGELAQVGGISEIRATATEGSATLTLSFERGTDLDFATLRARARVEAARARLPENTFVAVQRFDTSAFSNFLMVLSLRGDVPPEQVKRLADDVAIPDLSAVEGVVRVEAQGGESLQVAAFLRPDVARSRGVTVASVQQAIAGASQPVVSVGTVDDGARRLPVVVDGRATRLEDIADAPVGTTGHVRLEDVADIRPGIGASVERYRVNGQPSLGLYVFKDPSANLLAVAHRLRARIDAFNASHAREGASLHVDFDGAREIENRLAEVRHRGLAGALLALAVLLVFLRDPRPVAVVGLAVPASLLVAACLFKVHGLSLNIISLLGLALSVGMLLDNSIVVLEAIAARRERGDPPIVAARRGASRVMRAIVSATVATVVVFVPLLFVKSDYTPLFAELAASITYPLASSLLVAVALVPMLASRLPGSAAAEDRVRLPGRFGLPRPDVARSAYSALLRVCLRAPGATIAVSLALILVTLIFGVPLLLVFAEPPRPADDRIEIVGTLPAGTDATAADVVARQLEALARDIPQVDEVRTSARERQATVTIVFKKKEDRTGRVDIDGARERLRTKVFTVPGVSVQVDPPPATEDEGGGPDILGQGGSRETIRLSGPEGNDLTRLAEEIRLNLTAINGVDQVSSDFRQGYSPTVEIRADRRRLAEYGVTTAEIMGVVWATQREGQVLRYPFRLDDHDVDLVLYVEGADSRTLADIRAFPLATSSGAHVPLQAVASVLTGVEPPRITRFQRQRSAVLSYGFSQEALASASATEGVRRAVDSLAADLVLPPGFHVDVKHANSQLASLWQVIGLASLFVLAVLAVTFESVVSGVLVMLCAPLAIVGVVLVLVLSGTGVDLYVMLSFVVLLGVVVNHGILFVDRVQALVREGSRRPAAVMRASHDRLRPILMTTSVTVVGMIPLAVSTGAAQEIWPGFARAVIGGLVASTLLSLVLLPAAVLVFGRLGDVLRTLGPVLTTLTLAVTTGGLAWAYVREELVTGMAYRILLAPLVWLAVVALTRALQAALRGETPPDIVGEGQVDLRLRNVRKIYGGWPRAIRDYFRVQRWDDLARRAGLAASDVDTPRAALRRLTWQAGLISLAVYLHLLAQSTWGLFLLTLPLLPLLDQVPATLLALGRRPGRFPPRGWSGRLWHAAGFVAAWGYLFMRRRSGHDEDTVTLVFAGLVLGVPAVLHLVVEGGARALLARRIAPREVVALAGVSVAFENGLYGLLGPNGAGKSTLMRLVVNLYRPSRGTLTVNDCELGAHAASLQPRIGYLPQSFGLPPRLTARQYLHHQALLCGKRDPVERSKLVDGVLAEVGLADRADDRLGGYSGGMRQRVGIARTLLNLPRIVVVDEPTVGLDPRERIRFRNLLGELAKSRIVLLSTHVVEDIGSSCREVIVLDRGRILRRGPVPELVETARGRVWITDVAAAALSAFSAAHRIVSTTSLPDGSVRVRGVGEPPAGAVAAEPTLEDAYLLLLGASRAEAPRAA